MLKQPKTFTNEQAVIMWQALKKIANIDTNDCVEYVLLADEIAGEALCRIDAEQD